MWFILCRALKQLSAGARSRTAAKTALFNVYFWHTQKNSLQKLSAACRWIFLLLVLLQSENRPATNKVLKAVREKHNRVFMQTNPLHRESYYFMCSSISPRASSVVPQKSTQSKCDGAVATKNHHVCHINSRLAFCKLFSPRLFRLQINKCNAHFHKQLSRENTTN